MTLTERQRTVLAAVADVLIPRHGSAPSAGEVDLAGTPIDDALRHRPDVYGAFVAALDACEARDAEGAVDDLAASRPDLLAALALLVSGAYLMTPKALRAVDFVAPPRTLVDDVDAYVDLLANVVERGFEIR